RAHQLDQLAPVKAALIEAGQASEIESESAHRIVASGQWSVASGQLWVASNPWPAAIHQTEENVRTSSFRLATGHWPLATASLVPSHDLVKRRALRRDAAKLADAREEFFGREVFARGRAGLARDVLVHQRAAIIVG